MLYRRRQSGGTVRHGQMDAVVRLGSRTEQSEVADGWGSRGPAVAVGAVGKGLIIRNRPIEAVGGADVPCSLDGAVGTEAVGWRFTGRI